MQEQAVRVNEVEVIGADHTREWVIAKTIRPLLTSGTQTMDELMATVQQTCAQLNQLGIFKDDVEVMLDKPEDLEITAMDGMSIITPVDVIIRVKERARRFFKTGTEVGATEGSVYASAHYRNAFGACEHFEASLSRGFRTRTAFQGLFRKPLFADPRNLLELSAFQNEQDWSDQSSSVETQRGVCAKWKTLSRFGMHELSAESVWRELGQLSSNASFSIRESAGHTLKTAISHALIRDSRDNQFSPSTGYYVRLYNELASVTGRADNHLFLKNEFETQLVRNPLRNLILSGTVKCGLLATNGPTSSIHDRFFIGGPLSLRGFLARGIGPRSVLIPGGFRSDALGGDAYWTAGLSAFTPIPGLARYDSLRAHFFVNAGSLVPLEGGAALAELPARIRQIFSSAPISSSVGAGILLRTSIYRLEVNVTTPVTMSASDQRSPVLQFGLGMEFL